MNKWQIIFIVFGILATVLLFVFPPQIISQGTVKFLIFNSDYPIDWLRLFLWILAVIFITGLGVAINKEEHK